MKRANQYIRNMCHSDILEHLICMTITCRKTKKNGCAKMHSIMNTDLVSHVLHKKILIPAKGTQLAMLHKVWYIYSKFQKQGSYVNFAPLL